MNTASWYRRFAELEARGQSAIYEDWANGVADDAEVLALLDELPEQKRQPNLIFASARLLGAPEGPYAPFREWLIANWNAVTVEAMERSTQTNEARRCATLLPTLGLIDGPIALLEIGASGGLCLFPDRYSYRYDGGARLDPDDGPSAVLLESSTTGEVPIPARLPDIVWRAGVDLRPLDMTDSADTEWLETLVWPEQHERRARLRAAIAIASAEPPRLVQLDIRSPQARQVLTDLVKTAPADATLVVITSAVLVYIPLAERLAFVEVLHSLGGRWISLEGLRGLPLVRERLGAAGVGDDGRFVLALDEHPLAFTGPHGQTLDWL